MRQQRVKEYQLELFLYLRHDVGLGTQANELIDLLAVLENQHRWDGHDLEHGTQSAFFIHVDLDYGDVLTEFFGDLLKDRGQLLTRTTPFGPEVHDDWLACLYDVSAEGISSDVFNVAHVITNGSQPGNVPHQWPRGSRSPQR